MKRLAEIGRRVCWRKGLGLCGLGGWLLGLGLLLPGCGERFVPKPYGYYRIDLPEHAYQAFGEAGYPYAFAYSRAAEIKPRTEPGEQYWIDIWYPAFDARIHCSYKLVAGHLRELSDDAQDFVFKHAGKATAIPEQGYENPDKRVYGVYYELKGNTASPYQFYLTDSLRHFFRAAVYFNCHPNQDSLAPVIDYLRTDVLNLIESFEWQ